MNEATHYKMAQWSVVSVTNLHLNGSSSSPSFNLVQCKTIELENEAGSLKAEKIGGRLMEEKQHFAKKDPLRSDNLVIFSS